MSNSGALILFVSLGILIVVSLVAINDFRANINDSNPIVRADADMGTSVISPLYTVFAYVALAIASIALLKSFGNL
jgi:hypothetical protein